MAWLPCVECRLQPICCPVYSQRMYQPKSSGVLCKRGAAALLFPGEVSAPSPFVLCTSPFAQSETESAFEADEKVGCARQFVFDPCAQDGAERGLRLARRLGASDAAGIVGVQQALVRKLAREYLKLRFREGLPDVPPVGGV